MLLTPLILAAHLAGGLDPVGCFTPVMAAIDSAQTRADTLALAERMLAHPPLGKEICGKLVAGYLLGMSSSPAESEWQQRQRAKDLLNEGLRGNEDDPRLYFAMGVVFFRSGIITDARRLLDRAKERLHYAVPRLTPHELATMHYLYGSMFENSWRTSRSWGALTSTASGQSHCPAMDNAPGVIPSFDAFFYICSQTWDEVLHAFWRDWRENARPLYNEMVDELEETTRLEPARHAPALELLAEYYYERDFARAYDLVRRMLRATPDDPEALTAAGAIYHAMGRDSVAQVVFNRAFDHMTPEERRVYEDITPLLKRDDSTRFVAADSTLAARATQAFWNSVDPLYVTPYNERRLEHYARVATVDMLFGVATLQQRGWDTDGGQIWIRYGRPSDIYEFSAAVGGRDVYWVYDTHGLRFAFHRNLGSRRYRFDEFGQNHAAELKETQPERGTAFFADSGIMLDHQLVRLLGADDKPQVLLYTPWPPDFPRNTSVGLTLLDGDFQPVAQWRGTRTSRDGVGAQLDALRLGTFALAFEIWDPAYRRLARVRDTVTVRSFANGLAVSDILLATRIRPRGEGRALVKADLDITPAYGTTLRAGNPVGLYWETYGLTPDSSGVRRYQVEVELKRSGGDLPTRVLRGLSGVFGGNRSTTVRYEGTALGARAIEWIELEGPVQRGDYIVHLTVTDRVTGVVTTIQRSFTIL
jgi:GWxTD domain-containing protein